MRVALVQLTVTDDPVANLAATLGFVRQAQTQGAQFILTPECTNGLWSNRAAQKAQLRREEDDPTLSALRDEAAKLGVWLLIGSLALLTGAADGRFANRSFLISPDGAVLARYDKIHMFDVDLPTGERHRESNLYTPGEAAVIARGREVFVGEGCIHCHSQFVRPGTKDVLLWGPEKPLAESLAAVPPLLGNRRQGPDLTQVGNRRSEEWNRWHLIAPRVVSPGSRMPSYAHLFREGDGRGEALVAYLASLGAETVEARAVQVAGWKPAGGVVADVAKGGRLFAGLCVNCHGPGGRGDGVLAKGLSVRPPDWVREGARRAGDEEAVARIIKFGIQGSVMAGHEYLGDDEVVSLARYVRSLQGAAKAP